MRHNFRKIPDLTRRVSAYLTTLCAMHMCLFGVTPARAATAAPAITSVTASYSVNPPTITITGKNFGTTTPGVTLDGLPLQIDLYTATAVVAVLPSSLSPGSYQLVLTDTATALQGAFDATIGAAGPEGPAGAQGPAGTSGPAGPHGPAGPAGQPGAAGATGPAGPTGPQGAIGAVGAIGPVGPVGPQGQQGTTGPAGPVGMSWQGPWILTATYALNAVVTYNGSSYISLINNNSTIEPDIGTGYWSLVAAAGVPGPQGTYGPSGPPGQMGPMGATGAAGLTGPQGPAGPAGPQGATGVAGPTGPQGPQGLGAVYNTSAQPVVELNFGVTTLATLSLPIGAYLISSVVTLENESGGSANGTCAIALTGPGSSTTYYFNLAAVASGATSLTIPATANFYNAPASVSVQCSTQTPGVVATIAQLMAVQATNFVSQ